MSIQPGLYVVATPIGNLADLSPRAREVLAAVDLIASEDTRHSGRLLAHFGIQAPQVSLHEHNERERANALVGRLLKDQSVALISDAGTPSISDPGLPLVRAARAANVPVFAVPGPCALVAALSVSGIATDRFVFEGFLPARSKARRHRLRRLADETRTLIFYESPHRIDATLAGMIDTFGAQRAAATARELTKRHETIHAGTLSEMRERAAAETRGEWVIVVAGAATPPASSDDDVERVVGILAAELPLKQAVSLAVKLTGAPRNRVYALALARRDGAL